MRATSAVTNNMKMLTVATIATWTIFLSGSLAQEEDQRCYACGPEAAQWFPNAISPSCDNFSESEQFSINCGNDYKFCGITTNSKTNILSRICSKNLTENCTVENNDTELNILCTCNTTLCNGMALGEEIAKSFSMMAETVEKPETFDAESNTKNETESSVDDSNKSIESTTQLADTMMNDDSNVPINPIVLSSEEKKDNSNDTNIHIMTPNKSDDTVSSQTLPSPAALGQDGKPVPRQGAPVDDEEDNAEGSGSRIENEQKSNNNPTTTTPAPTPEPTTTLAPKNHAASLHENIILKFLIWTISINYLFF
ncbi:uncharacterized protein LOC143911091 [Arctopsyche grandis]|uniref:uncharacterized protein LOC143911091 n=1 Tax=Arctopsyche grandis TaxID=121162 RepID=UPI00406D7AFD